MIVLLITACPTASLSQSQRSSLAPTLVNDGLLSMDCRFKDDKNGWIVGEFGKMLSTNDGGETWTRARLIDDNLNSVSYCNSTDTYWTVGASGRIAFQKASDNWKSFEHNLGSTDLWGVDFSRGGTMGLIVGDGGTMLRYSHATTTWEALKKPVTTTLYGSSFDDKGTTAITCGEQAVLLVSKDAQFKTWTSLLSEESKEKILRGSILSCWLSPDGSRAVASAANGFIINVDLITKEVRIKKVAEGNLRALWFDKSMQNGWAVSSLGEIIRTSDRGYNWKLDYKSDPERSITSVAIHEDTKGVAVGRSNLLVKYDNGKWTQNFTGHNYDLASVQDKTFVASDQGLFLMRDGLKYERISPVSVKEKFYKVFSDGKRVWVCGTNTSIYSSDADGGNWTRAHSETDGVDLNAIYFNSSDDMGVAIGDKGKVLVKPKGESKWIQHTIKDVGTSDLNDVSYVDGTYFIAGDKGLVFASDDRGETWIGLKGVPTNLDINAIAFSSDGSTGYVAGACNNEKADEHLFATHDKGKTWHPGKSFIKITHYSDVIFSAADSSWYLTTFKGDIYKSPDQGNNWFQFLPTDTNGKLFAITDDGKGRLLAGGDNGLLIESGRPDFFPTIKNFQLTDSADYFKVLLAVSDNESRLEDITVRVVIEGDVLKGTDTDLISQNTTYNELNELKAIPKSILKANTPYTFKLFASDGWNVVSKEIKVKVGQSFSEQFVHFMRWDELPHSFADAVDAIKVNIAFLSLIYVVVLLILFYVAPLQIFYWQEFLARAKFPYSEKAAPWLALTLASRKRVLNAFVDSFSTKAEKIFRSNEDVASRPYWVAAPFDVDGAAYLSFSAAEAQQNYVAGLFELRQHVDGERVILSIDGPGGIGKSSLAFQIARWAASSNPKKRLFNERMLPLFTNKVDSAIDDICRRKLELIANRSLSESFTNRLLETRRALIVIDGVTEMADFDLSFIDPERGGKKTQCIVLTSRKTANLPSLIKVIPMGLKLDFLDPLLDGFVSKYVGAFRFGKQREVLRSRVVSIIEEMTQQREEALVPLLILRLAVDKAKRLVDEDKALVDYFPGSLTDLVDDYLEDVFRKHPDQDQLFLDLRYASIVSMGFHGNADFRAMASTELTSDTAFRPAWVTEKFYASKLNRASLRIFVSSGLMIESGTKDDRLLKFTYDPIAEYLVAKAIAIERRDRQIEQKIFDAAVAQVYARNTAMYLMLIGIAHRMNIELPPVNMKMEA